MILVLPPFLFNNPDYMEIAKSMFLGVEIVENKPIINGNTSVIPITVK